MDIRSNNESILNSDRVDKKQNSADSEEGKCLKKISTENSTVQITINTCGICKQNGICISLIIDPSKILSICEFCYRKVLFIGINNISPSIMGWKLIDCDLCKIKRLKSDNESRFCNCQHENT